MNDRIKIGLVQINQSYSNVFYFPYSVALLESYFNEYSDRRDDFEFLDPIFFRRPVEDVYNLLSQAEIIAFSIYTWNNNSSLQIAKYIKQQNNNVKIVFGGPNVPETEVEQFMDENPFIDISCHGEGERAFMGILENYPSINDSIPSITYRGESGYITNPTAARIKDVNTVPSPYMDGTFDKLMANNPDYKWMALWETNRGCPFACSFCNWGSATKSKVYKFDMDRLKDEVMWFVDHEIEFIYCCDANFGIFERDLDIVKIVSSAKKKSGYPKSLSVHDTKNITDRTFYIQEMLYKYNLSKGVSIAVQSLNSSVLKNISRHNPGIEVFEDFQHRFNLANMESYTEFIQALPGETYDSLASGMSKAIDMGQFNRIRLGVLSVLPNTKMSEIEYQKEHGLQITKAENTGTHTTVEGPEVVDTHEMVTATNTMPKDDWIKAQVFGYWCSLLHGNKTFHIPFLVFRKIGNLNYRQMIELFFLDDSQYPVISEMHKFFYDHAIKLQTGEGAFIGSAEWLNIYWPVDEYMFIKLTREGLLNEFYKESENIFEQHFVDHTDILRECIKVNMSIMKVPFQTEDLIVETKYNIWEAYRNILDMNDIDLQKTSSAYSIDRTSEKWGSWEEWEREVVWYGNRQGRYIYKVNRITT